MQVRDFVLAQPEVTKFRWKDTDFTQESVAAAAGGSSAPAAAAAATPKPGKGKGQGKKKASAKKAAATPATKAADNEL